MITRNPARMGGHPCIDNTRITAGTILLMLARHSDADVLAAYPALTQAHLDGVRAWWASPEGIRWALEEQRYHDLLTSQDIAPLLLLIEERAFARAEDMRRRLEKFEFVGGSHFNRSHIEASPCPWCGPQPNVPFRMGLEAQVTLRAECTDGDQDAWIALIQCRSCRMEGPWILAQTRAAAIDKARDRWNARHSSSATPLANCGGARE